MSVIEAGVARPAPAGELLRYIATRSRASSCCDYNITRTHGDIARHDSVFCHRYPTEACVTRKIIPFGVLVGCEALGTKVSLILGMATES